MSGIPYPGNSQCRVEIRDVHLKQAVARILSPVKSLPQEAGLAQSLPWHFAAANTQPGHRLLPKECRAAPLGAKGPRPSVPEARNSRQHS